ncbi:Uncharacterized protein FWK35_00033700 [Aphis craccivora]|uniref:Endonuclease/exonuclease/phosphatase domain-containing protein n=1 Tax=Aphis craccivora TaxID=307492 RepID=A0A6G0VYA6_APHCR|nr:Uncharacterized protein FWK35_00033700 [Aphis craccivora]
MVDIVLLQEPLIQQQRVYAFEGDRQAHKGEHAGAAIIILNSDLRIMELAQHTNEFIVAVRISKHDDSRAVTVVSAYFKYNMPTPCFIEKLHTVLEDEKRVLIGGDVNAHSEIWHCAKPNERGRMVECLIDDHDLRVANRPSPLKTYEREGMGSSNIDVTLSTPNIINKISDWSVMDNTDSDHNTIVYKFKINSRQPPNDTSYTFITRKADWNKFTLGLLERKSTIDKTTLDTFARSLVSVIQSAAKASMPSGRTKCQNKNKQPWWNDQLSPAASAAR